MKSVQSPIIPVVGELIRQNPGTISLGQGVVAYPPPDKAISNLQNFLQDAENHKYKAVEGIPPLIEAITRKLAKENNLELDRDLRIVVTAGSNMAFNNALLAITRAGDEIILQAPYYFNHEMAIAMANCHGVIVPTDDNYQLLPEKIVSAITPRTKAIVTISPNNPTGAVYSRESLQQVNQICRDRGIYHISDEAYDYFTYNGVQHHSPASFPGSHAHTISLFSLSKSYGFASWRIGYMVIPEHLFLAIKKVQDTNLICPPVISQYAALGALEAGYAYCQPYIQEIDRVRKLLLEKLRSREDLFTLPQADGAFYFFLKVRSAIDDLELVEKLIKQYGVAVIPGSTFGMKEGCYLRIAYGALSEDNAIAGIERLLMGLESVI